MENSNSNMPAYALKKHIGEKLRLMRIEQNITQRQLSEKIGVTYQQLQKYERGLNNITASKLFLISQVLKRPITDFFTVKIHL